ncbi:MAG: TIGR04076 family protein [Chloroflexi bacterium]|nr:TIGR04076 family protein [Chloroflexota bacterium]
MIGPPKTHKIKVEVTKVGKGVCPNGMKPGRNWILDSKTPGGICLGALSTILPYARAISFGGTFYFQETPDSVEFSCPDHERHVTFRLTRLKE